MFESAALDCCGPTHHPPSLCHSIASDSWFKCILGRPPSDYFHRQERLAEWFRFSDTSSHFAVAHYCPERLFCLVRLISKIQVNCLVIVAFSFRSLLNSKSLILHGRKFIMYVGISVPLLIIRCNGEVVSAIAPLLCAPLVWFVAVPSSADTFFLLHAATAIFSVDIRTLSLHSWVNIDWKINSWPLIGVLLKYAMPFLSYL